MCHSISIFKKFLEISQSYKRFNKSDLDILFQRAWDLVQELEPKEEETAVTMSKFFSQLSRKGN